MSKLHVIFEHKTEHDRDEAVEEHEWLDEWRANEKMSHADVTRVYTNPYDDVVVLVSGNEPARYAPVLDAEVIEAELKENDD